MVEIRSAIAADAEAIAHVHVESWRSTYAGILPADFLAELSEADRAAQWRAWLGQDVVVLVAELDGRVAGFISGGPARDGVRGCDAELYAVYLLEGAQRAGMGTELLRVLAGRLVERGLKSMVVWVLEVNPAREFYMKRGAVYAASKLIEVGGVELTEAAYAWGDISPLLS